MYMNMQLVHVNLGFFGNLSWHMYIQYANHLPVGCPYPVCSCSIKELGNHTYETMRQLIYRCHGVLSDIITHLIKLRPSLFPEQID